MTERLLSEDGEGSERTSWCGTSTYRRRGIAKTGIHNRNAAYQPQLSRSPFHYYTPENRQKYMYHPDKSLSASWRRLGNPTVVNIPHYAISTILVGINPIVLVMYMFHNGTLGPVGCRIAESYPQNTNYSAQVITQDNCLRTYSRIATFAPVRKTLGL